MVVETEVEVGVERGVETRIDSEIEEEDLVDFMKALNIVHSQRSVTSFIGMQYCFIQYSSPSTLV